MKDSKNTEITIAIAGSHNEVIPVFQSLGVLGVGIIKTTGAIANLTVTYFRGYEKNTVGGAIDIVYGDVEATGLTINANTNIALVDFDLANKPCQYIKMNIANITAEFTGEIAKVRV